MELDKNEVHQLLIQVSDHERRIDGLEKVKHECFQATRLCDIESTQKKMTEGIEKLRQEVIGYTMEASKQTKTIIVGFVAMIITILVTSIGLYRDVISTIDSKFIKTYEIINEVRMKDK
jgi:hypothetical protein